MANTWNGMFFANIARLGIDTLRQALMPLSVFTTDYSVDLAQQGDTVTTRIVPNAAATQDLISDHSGDYSLVTQDKSTTAVPIVLGPHPINGFHFTDQEFQEISSGVWSDTAKRLVRAHIYGIASSVLDAAFNLITAANFGAAAFTGASSVFDVDDVATVKNVAVKAGWNFGTMNPSLILTPDYHTALEQDNQVQDTGASGSDVLQTGVLPRLSGFGVMEAPTLPPAGGTPAAENLTGFAALSDGIAIAMRGVDTQDRSRFLHYEILQDPITGAVITYSALWTDKFRRVEHIFEALFGVKEANPASIKRIVSA